MLKQAYQTSFTMIKPIKYSPGSEILPIIIILLSLCTGLFFWAHFPNRIASHWDIQGNDNGYANGLEGVIMLPAVLICIYLLFLMLPVLDPKKDRYQEFNSAYFAIRNILMAILFIIYICTGLFNLGYPVNISIIMPFLTGILFIVIGKYIGKIKPNWFIGIRTPWTLSSDTVWDKTHRLGGYLFMIFGLILMIIPWVDKTFKLPFMICGVLIISLGTIIYSFIEYHREKSHKHE
jgi:uncharacterized membrane protein